MRPQPRERARDDGRLLRTAPIRRTLGLLVGLTALAGACADEDTLAADLARERAAAHFTTAVTEHGSFDAARQALAPLVGKDAAYEDLIRAAAVEFAAGAPDAAEAFLARAEQERDDAPEVSWLRGQIAKQAGGLEGIQRAAEHFRAVNAARPDDLPTRIELAQVEADLGNAERAEELYRSVVAVGIENGEQWYVAAVYKLLRLLTTEGRDDEAMRYMRVWSDLEQLGAKAPEGMTMSLGNLGQLRPPEPPGIQGDRPDPLPEYAAESLDLPALAGARELFAHDLDGDGDLDLVAAGPGGVAVGLHTDAGWRQIVVATNDTPWVRAFDVDDDADLDLLLPDEAATGGALALFRCELEAEGARWERAPLELPSLPALPSDVVAVDFDHEGDLDLLLVGSFGTRLWRHDGADAPEAGGAFVDATDGSGLPAGTPFHWCLTEDFDGDNDVDFLLGGGSPLVLADSLRGGRFATDTDAFPAGTALDREPLVADVDGDARPDVFPLGARQPWLRDPSGRYAVTGGAAGDGRAHVAIDLDLDGVLDVVAGGTDGVRARLAAGLEIERDEPVRSKPTPVYGATLVAGDLDLDLDVDLASSHAGGVLLLRSPGAASGAKRLALRGVKDNRRAVGTVVEYRAGRVYQRIYWRGEPVLCGVGEADRIDVLRMTWPNGTVSTALDVDLADETSLDDPNALFGEYDQPAGQVGSCPFLYTWNGATYEFISDVLGITPLGLPMAPGMMVPPDHDEYVLVRGEQLVPRDGVLELQFTEELREVTYLDQARLLAVDHPRGSRVYPNERFTFPPFPEHHIHTVTEAHAPTSATGSDGRDWTAELARVDDVHADPMTLERQQFLGLAEPWFLELSFDPEVVRGKAKLRLVMTGWLFWADASSNMASARHPRVAFVPPILQIPGVGSDGTTEWKDAGPPIGFVAGKTKTMVIDVTDVLSSEDPRLRIFTTLRTYWDAIELAVCDDDAELRVTTLGPVGTELWSRGFSAPLEPERLPGELPESRSTPERFDWERLAERPRWDQHPGLYTRFGDCTELLDEVDDRFAILGSGDALTVRFDARALPEVPAGFTRDWLVYLDGWAKDRDHNTIEALEVEPLPFHGMSGYPYGPDESFPDDDAHRRWRADWNTRPQQRWIAPVAPVREAAWLLTGN